MVIFHSYVKLPEGINGKDDENMIKSDPQLSFLCCSGLNPQLAIIQGTQAVHGVWRMRPRRHAPGANLWEIPIKNGAL